MNCPSSASVLLLLLPLLLLLGLTTALRRECAARRAELVVFFFDNVSPLLLRSCMRHGCMMIGEEGESKSFPLLHNNRRVNTETPESNMR
jgi:hypothetical protein